MSFDSTPSDSRIHTTHGPTMEKIPEVEKEVDNSF